MRPLVRFVKKGQPPKRIAGVLVDSVQYTERFQTFCNDVAENAAAEGLFLHANQIGEVWNTSGQDLKGGFLHKSIDNGVELFVICLPDRFSELRGTIKRLIDEYAAYADNKPSTLFVCKDEVREMLEDYQLDSFIGKLNMALGGINRDFKFNPESYPKIATSGFDVEKFRVMMVAEKPRMAQEIAKKLSAYERKESYSWNGARPTSDPIRKEIGNCTAWIYDGTFNGTKAEFCVTHTYGNLLDLDDTVQKNGENMSLDELFECDIHKVLSKQYDEKKAAKTSERAAKTAMSLVAIAKISDHIVMWLDRDLAGERISFDVLNVLCDSLRVPPSSSAWDITHRAYFSSSLDFVDAMENLEKPNYLHALASEAKAELDLRVGLGFTRGQTQIIRKLHNDRWFPPVSYGPCQTPTLALVVKAEEMRKITISGECDERKEPIVLVGPSGKNEEEAVKFVTRLNEVLSAYINVIVTTEEHTLNPPLPLNTLKLLRMLSKHYKSWPSRVMSAAQWLYQSGFISYTRVRSSAYPNGLDLEEMLLTLGVPTKGTDPSHPSRGTDEGDHPPILPVKRYYAMQRPFTFEQFVYDYIVRHFTATLMPACKVEVTTIRYEIEGAEFSARKSFKVLEPGFTSQLTEYDVNDGTTVASTTTTQQMRLTNVTAAAKRETLPTWKLIEEMEKNRIGTPGSTAEHIDKLVNKGLVERENGCLTPTYMGTKLVQMYEQFDPEFISPQLRRDFETKLLKIANGEADYDDVIYEELNYYASKFKSFMDQLKDKEVRSNLLQKTLNKEFVEQLEAWYKKHNGTKKWEKHFGRY